MTAHVDRPAFEDSLHLLLIGATREDAHCFEGYLRDGMQEASLHWENDFETGLQVLREESPDVLILDLGLSDSGGTETVRRCVEAAPAIPVVVLTESKTLETVQAALQSGAAEYLQKGELSPVLVQRTLRWAFERKERGQRLDKQAAQLRSIAEHSSEGIFRSTPDEGLVSANQAFAEMFGYESVETVLEVDPATLCVDPTDQGALIRAVEVEGEEDGRGVKFRRRDGSIFTGLLRGSVTRDGPRETVHFDGVITDITNCRQRDKEGEERNPSHWALPVSAQEAVVTINTDSTIQFANPAVEEIFGYMPDELVGELVTKLMPDRHRGRYREVVDRFRETEAESIDWPAVELLGLRKDGTEIDLSVSVAKKDQEGETFFKGIIHEITERKERKEALREERNRFATLFHNLPTPVVHGWPDEKGRIRVQAVNQSFETTFGRKNEDVQGEDIQSVIVPAEEQGGATVLRRKLLEGDPIDREVRRKAGGTLRDFRLQVALREEDGTPIEGFAIYTDITEQKRRERILCDREQKMDALYTEIEKLVAAQTRAQVAARIQALVSETFDYPLNGVHFVKDGHLVPAAVSPEVSDRVPEIPKPSLDGSNLGARAYRSGETVVVGDFSEVESEIDHGDLRSGACVLLGDHGVLLVGSAQTNGIDDFDVRLLELMGTHAATVLDRIEREDTLREERDLLDRILETSPVAIAVFNPDGEFVQASGRAEDVLGLEKDEVTDLTYNDPEWGITAPDGSPMPDEELPFARVMGTGEPVQDVEHAIVWPDGRRRLLSVSGAPLHDPEGEIEGAVFHIDDITERRQAERQLRESERRFRKLFTEAPIGIARLGLDGRIIETNAAFRDTLGYDAETLRGRHFRRFTYEEDGGEATEELSVLVGGETSSYTVEKRYRRSDGSVFWARLTASFLDHEGDTQIICMVQDIDDQKCYEEDLRAAKEEAERMNQLKSAFLANMSHEIRTPLTSILGFAEMIGERVAEDAEGVIPRYARRIEKSGRQLLETLNGVLNYSQLEAGEIEFSADAIDLNAEVKATAEQFEPQARDAEIDLQGESQGTSNWARADVDGLRVVLRNLLSNAIKYTEEGGQVWVRTRSRDEAVILEVEDTGIGMDPEKKEELFEAFAQESEGIGREYEGTGLGLAVTRRVVQEMGGSVEVETQKGRGSCFTVRLPKAGETV